jgi:putative Holliday junction resolvase
MESGRRIAFDFGNARIGVAISDASGLLASPGENLLAQSDDLVETLRNLLDDVNPIYIAIGKPLHLSGAESAKSEAVEAFATLVKSLVSVPIYFIDERLTTVSAARALRESGINAKEGKSKIDGMAAVGILESALNQERLQGVPSKETA